MFLLFIFTFLLSTLCPFPSVFADDLHPAVFILGGPEFSHQKHALRQRVLSNVQSDIDARLDATFWLFAASDNDDDWGSRFDRHLVQHFPLAPRAPTVVEASKSADEMSLTELQILREMIYYVNGGLLVVELGHNATQTSVILEHSTFCWGSTTLKLGVPNKVLLCNDVKVHHTELLSHTPIATIFQQPNDFEVPVAITWPSLLPSALAAETSAEKRHRVSHRTVQPTQRQMHYKHAKRGSQEEDGSSEDVRAQNPRVDWRVACKYRKSCYETGQLPPLHASTGDSEDEKDGKDNDDDEREVDLLTQKVRCKYRPSCYAEIGLDMNEANQEKSQGLFVSKTVHLVKGDKPAKKRNLREIAKRVVKELNARAEERARNPQPRTTPMEERLNELEEALQAKNRCKYRKSCYETGKVPEIEASSLPNWLPLHRLPSVVNNVFPEARTDERDFEELAELERKVHCKYRKSCYDTGVLPELDPQTRFQFKELVQEPDESVPLQWRCKYRKSCYETGVLPELRAVSQKVEAAAPKPVPTTLTDFKKQCKYRKTCYREHASLLPDDGVNEPERDGNAPERQSESAKTPKPKRHSAKSKEVVEPPSQELPVEAPAIKSPKIPETESVAAKKPKKSPKSKESVGVKSSTSEEPPKKLKKVPKQKSEEEVVPEPEPVAKPPAPKKKEKKRKEAAAEEPPQQEATSVRPQTGNNNDDGTKLDVRVKCKYRKSCYESGVLPEVAEGFFSLDSLTHLSFALPTLQTTRREAKEWAEMKELEQKVHCKYRKSCYDDGHVPEIHTQAYSFGGAFAAFQQHLDSTSQREFAETKFEELKELERKVHCKYRKSCYETGHVPQTHTNHFFSPPGASFAFWPSASARSASGSTKSWAELSEEARKVECKYRKSCYDTGKLPDSLHQQPTPLVIERLQQNPKETIQQQCRYRKSCYAAAQLARGQTESSRPSADNVIDAETLVVRNAKSRDAPTKQKKTDVENAATKEQETETSAAKKNAEKSTEKREKRQKKKKEANEEKKRSVSMEEDDEAPFKEIPPPPKAPKETEPVLGHVSDEIKSACKYRQSCYRNALANNLRPEQLLRHRVKCSMYRLSCREQLGLPPIVRAPIGPNGKKLCRKKKPATAAAA